MGYRIQFKTAIAGLPISIDKVDDVGKGYIDGTITFQYRGRIYQVPLSNVVGFWRNTPVD